MIIDGYVEYHKTLCPKLDCPSRKSIEKTKKL